MNKLIFVIGIMLMSLSGMAQYPIKTIFKGDSVIILTIQQSEKINEILEKSSKSIKNIIGPLWDIETIGPHRSLPIRNGN